MIYAVLFFGFFSGLVPSNQPALVPPENESLQKPTRALVTVFIHGTILPIPSWESLKMVYGAEKSNGASLYQQYCNALRFKGILSCQPINRQGLVVIDAGQSVQTPASMSAATFDVIYKNWLKLPYEQFSYYTFGWNGRLNNKSRKHAANELYRSLLDLKNQLMKDGYNVVDFDLYAHSHGGNVALNMGALEPDSSAGLTIKHLVLLGTPIQKDNAHCCFSPLFRFVYNFYSCGDALQIADFVSTNYYRSGRRFDDSKENKILACNIKNIECTVGDYKPRHTELFLYNLESNFLYRSVLDINPAPLFVHIPYLMYRLDNEDLSIDVCWNCSKQHDQFMYNIVPVVSAEPCNKNVVHKDITLQLPVTVFAQG